MLVFKNIHEIFPKIMMHHNSEMVRIYTHSMNMVILPKTKKSNDHFLNISKQDFLRSAIIMFLVSMSLYQSINLLIDYLDFRAIKVEETVNVNRVLAPAITFCLSKFLSFEVVQQLFPESSEKFEEIHRKIDSTNDSTIHFLESLRMEKLIKSYQIRAINQMSIHKAFNQSVRMFDHIENCLIVRQNNEHKCDFLNNTVRYIQESQKCSTMLYENQMSSIPSISSKHLELSYGDSIVFIISKDIVHGISNKGNK